MKSRVLVLLTLSLASVVSARADAVPHEQGADTPTAQRVRDVPFVRTPEPVVARMLELASVGPRDLLDDLGCGDGHVVVTAAKTYGAAGVGVDIDPTRLEEGRRNAARAGVHDRVRFVLEDLLRVDLSAASVVMLHLSREANLLLRPKLLRELRPGSRIASQHDMGEWKADATGSAGGASVYSWQVPAKVGGRWRVELPGAAGDASGTLELVQSFQEVGGTARIQGVAVGVSDAHLLGTRLELTLHEEGRPPMRLRGRVDGARIDGTVDAIGGGPIRPWSAERRR